MRLRDWNTPAMNVVHGLLIVCNVIAGFFNLHGPGTYHGALSFFVAGLILSVNIFGGVTSIRHRALRRRMEQELHRLQREQAYRVRMNPQMGAKEMYGANVKALENLRRIVTHLGAFFDEPCVQVTAMIRGRQYVIGPSSIYRMGVALEVTCYYTSAAMPVFEIMASALLLLHHDPKIFDKWMVHNGELHA